MPESVITLFSQDTVNLEITDYDDHDEEAQPEIIEELDTDETQDEMCSLYETLSNPSGPC